MKPDHDAEYRVEEREDGYLLKYLLVNKNGDELERWEAWIPNGDYAEKKRQSSNVALLMNQCDQERLGAMAQLDKATELLEAATAHLEDCSRDIVLRRAEDVLQARGRLALEMANRLRAFLDERK